MKTIKITTDEEGRIATIDAPGIIVLIDGDTKVWPKPEPVSNDTHTIELTEDQVECVLNSFSAQKLRIKDNVRDAKARKAMKEVDEWGKTQARSDATAKTIRDQAGREDPFRKGEEG